MSNPNHDPKTGEFTSGPGGGGGKKVKASSPFALTKEQLAKNAKIMFGGPSVKSDAHLKKILSRPASRRFGIK